LPGGHEEVDNHEKRRLEGVLVDIYRLKKKKGEVKLDERRRETDHGNPYPKWQRQGQGADSDPCLCNPCLCPMKL